PFPLRYPCSETPVGERPARAFLTGGLESLTRTKSTIRRRPPDHFDPRSSASPYTRACKVVSVPIGVKQVFPNECRPSPSEVRRLPQDSLGDDDPLDLSSALENIEHLDVAIPLLDELARLEPGRPHHLDRVRANSHRRFGRIGLRHRRL